jgi:hypothetical protein
LKSNNGISFSILEIITEEDLRIPFGCQSIKEYEDWFLRENSCCKSKDWFNRYSPDNAAYGTSEFKNLMLKKYGVEHQFELEIFREKRNITNTNRYGGNSPMCSEDVRSTHIQNLQQKYGKEYTNYAQLDWVKDKIEETNLIRYGGIAPICNKEVKNKMISTIQKTYGEKYINGAQLEFVKDKIKKTNIEKYGTGCPANSIKNKENILENLQQKYGKEYTNYAQLPEIKQKTKSNNLLKYGVDHQNKLIYRCSECNRESKGLSSLKRYHKNHFGILIKYFDKFISYDEWTRI